MDINNHSTVEDFLTFTKTSIQNFLRENGEKLSGNKQELAVRAFEANLQRYGLRLSLSTTLTPDEAFGRPDNLPDISDVKAGWTSDIASFPKFRHTDIENYLLLSSHRTGDHAKMQCFRQFIRGFNFFKEKYIHKLMVNNIDENREICFVRSKCFPSMKKGTYEQWILTKKEKPHTVLKASCSCPAGLGEGCTHVAGLLFALEDAASNRDDLACTSKPCEWSKPSKRSQINDPIDQIHFKKLKFGNADCSTTKTSLKKLPSINKDSFFKTLCSKIPSHTNPVLFHMIEPSSFPQQLPVEHDLNVSQFEEVVTTEHIEDKADKYINLSLQNNKNLSKEDFFNFVKSVPVDIVESIEKKTRGQSENVKWQEARKNRITASIFHDVLCKKQSTSPVNLVQTILGNKANVSTAAIVWGRKHEIIAKKRYIAVNRLKHKRKLSVVDSGLFLCVGNGHIGASPDGVVDFNSDKWLIEIKCPFKWRHSKISEACKSSDFCCTCQNEVFSLKKTHRYYTQVQGQMGVTGVHKCDFIIYTLKDLVIIPITFDVNFWDLLLPKLTGFYLSNLIPHIIN